MNVRSTNMIPVQIVQIACTCQVIMIFLAAITKEQLSSMRLVSFCKQQFNWHAVFPCKIHKITYVIQFLLRLCSCNDSATKRKFWLLNMRLARQAGGTQQSAQFSCYILSCWRPPSPPSAMYSDGRSANPNLQNRCQTSSQRQKRWSFITPDDIGPEHSL